VCHTVVALSGAEIRMKAHSARVELGGHVQPDPAEGLAVPLIQAASVSPRARDALVIVGRQDPTWSELYLLFELVQGDVGGRMHDQGWISKADADRFTHTANSYSVLRSAGRHGKDPGRPPPANPMPHAFAADLIRQLVLSWLRSVAGSEGNTSHGEQA
jgi:hypothetical protein